MKNFIQWIYENNLFIKDGIIYDTTYACREQYRCENAMCILYVLKLTYRVMIDIWINVKGHGISKIYSINWSEKTHLKQKCFLIGTKK